MGLDLNFEKSKMLNANGSKERTRKGSSKSSNYQGSKMTTNLKIQEEIQQHIWEKNLTYGDGTI